MTGWFMGLPASSLDILAVLFAAILALDMVVWIATKRLLTMPEGQHSGLVEVLMDWLGSWPALIAMGALSAGWATYDFNSGHSQEPLDIVISIWTMLLDVLVIIGANYTRQRDRQLLTEIRDRLNGGDNGKRLEGPGGQPD